MIRVVVTSLLLAFGASAANAAVESVDVWDPRAYGYFLGDTFERDVEVVTTGNTELITSSLPRPGTVTYWLDLLSVDQKMREAAGKRIYNLRLKYQIFYSAIQATQQTVPAIALAFRNADAPAVPPPSKDGVDAKNGKGGTVDENVASIPALSLTISPLRDIVLTDVMPEKQTEIADILKPDTKATTIPTASLSRLFAASLAAMALATALLLWHYALWPFSRRPRRPFTLAERRIRSLASKADGEGTYKESLLQLHRAIDETFGRRVFAADLPDFLNERSNYLGLKPKLEAFFENSRRYFFSGNKGEAEAEFPLDAVKDLAADLSREERAAA